MQYEAQPINLFNGYGYIYFLKRVFAQTPVQMQKQNRSINNLIRLTKRTKFAHNISFWYV